MNMTRIRSTLATAAAIAALAMGGAAAAQPAASYPDKPVTLVVPTAAAGGTDTMARLFAEVLSQALKKSFVVENRPGANGILGVEHVARAPADGYKLLFTYAASMAVNPSLYRKLPYDPVKDFAPIAQIGQGGNLLLVRKDFPARDLQEFVAHVKANPDKFSYCSWGAGSGGHLAMESLKKQAGLVMTHVPYKGTTPCVQDLMGAQIDAGFADVSSTVEIVRSGRVRALAYSGAARLPMLAQVPTLTESGYPFKNYSWYGLFAPAGTPAPIVDKLNVEVNRALKDPAVIKRMSELNFADLPVRTPAQFGEVLRQDIDDWRALIKAVGVSLD